MSSTGERAPPRLTPAMSSRRLQVLDFIRDYIASHNAAPSLGEIAGGMSISRTRAHELVRALIRNGQLMRRPGMRGLMLPSAIEEAKRQLREAGYSIDEDITSTPPPAPPLTESRLLPLPPLDYDPDRQQGDGDGGAGDGEAGGGEG